MTLQYRSIGLMVLLTLAIALYSSALPEQRLSSYPPAKHGGGYMHNFYFPPGASSTPWAPAWAPDGRSIAVAMSGSIWRVDPASGLADELTCNNRYHSMPRWSPDGRWIVYTADDDGRTIQLEMFDTASNKTHRLTDDAFLYMDPVFSPDGTRLAYMSTKSNGYFNVYVRPIRDGQFTGEEIAITSDHSYGKERLYFGRWDMHLSPAWLPNGKELLLVSNRDVPLGSGNVLRVPAETHGIERAQTVLAEQTLYRTRPDVSIDGKRFVYSSTCGAADQFNNLYVQPIAGGTPYKLTFFAHDAFHPRWSPDGEWIAYISNAGGLPQLALLETYGGKQRTVPITGRRWRRPMGWLSVRTLDRLTNKATASRIHLVAADNKFYAPNDAYARVASTGVQLFHQRGEFQVQLPVGRASLEVVKGFEYWPQKREVEIQADQTTDVAVVLEPMVNMADRGWYSGSTHVHMNYGGNLHNTLENLMLMSAAEDQDVVNVHIANKDNRVLDHQFFVPGGGPHPVSTIERLVVVGQEYRPPFYGHAFMFGMREHLISPFTTGYEGTAIESLYPSNTDMFRKARAQGATVGYVHAFGGESDPLRGCLGNSKGYMVDAALGTIDAVEWSNSSRGGFFPWYATLNNGLRVTAVGGEDSISNLHRSKLVGCVRTYVYTGKRGLQMQAWFEGLRQGHVFVSTGPLVELTINGRMPGDEIKFPASGGMVEVEVHVQSIVPLTKVLLVFNGTVIDELKPTGDRRQMDFKRSYPVKQSGWFHLRAEGNPEDKHPLDTGYPLAFTNPVWVMVGNRPVRSRPAAEYSIEWIDRLRKMAEAWPGWRSEQEQARVFAQFDEARRVYERLATEADTLADGKRK
jgi:Tol biopolymer transport system component